jgi:hypothetical protein
MRRRKLVATAGALAVTAFGATLALGANLGLVGQAEPDSPVGRLDARRSAATAPPAAVPAAESATVPVTTPRLGPDADD